MSKKTLFFAAITILLVVAIASGIWVLVNRQAREPSQSVSEQQPKEFSMNEVTQHASKEDCWTIISGNVYDLTEFVNRHPGGDEILRACGTDATTLFTKRQTQEGQPVGSGSPHSPAASEQLAKLKIGTLVKR